MPHPEDDTALRAEQRVIRVFISSTFRDMKAERDYLVKFIFPQLRQLCERRQVVWGEVDLRWGVTDEQAAEGRVLTICLEEIKRCRPYFIGLLGERYGWVPEAIPQEVINREPWLREHVHGRKSVTELEILHGVLNNPDMADHAFFYFRDPDYLNRLPAGSDRSDFISETPESKIKLAELKQVIRTSPFSVHENYFDPQALGKLILDDLTGVVDQLYPEGSELDPLDREAMDHEAFARSRRGVYVGRSEYFQRLDAHADGSGDQPLVVLGESGSGKSALLANWIVSYRERHPDLLLLQHYIGATPFSADWAQMLRRIMSEFKRRFGIGQEIPDKPEEFRSVFPNWLHMAAAKGRVVLVLDALNQLEDRDGAPDLVWLPPVIPEGVRLIASTLPGRPLEEITKRNWPTMPVQLLDADERELLIGELLAHHAKRLNAAQTERIASASRSANPLYLRVLLDELRQFGEHERLEERIHHYLEAESIADLYIRVIERWHDDYNAGFDLVHQSLTMLWAARRGLTESELLDILGTDGEPLPRATWSPLYLAMSDSLVSRGGLLTFAHDFLRMATKEVCLRAENDQNQAHLRLAGYFERQPANPRRIGELPWQLAEGAAWQRLYDLLAEPEFFKTVWRQREFDTKSYWARIESSSPLRMIEAFQVHIERPEQVVDTDFLWKLGTILDDMGHPEEALAIRSVLTDHFRATGDQDNYQASLGNQANVLYLRGDLDGAMALHKEKEQICRQLGNLEGLQASLGSQANILYSRGDLDGAMALHKEQERICRQLGNLEGLQASLGNQANILYSRGDLDGAMALHKEKERTCRQLGNLDSLSASLGNRANILYSRGALDGAMVLHKEEERVCRQLGNLDSLQRCLGNQALILDSRGDLDGAMALHKEEERICRQLGNLDSLQRSLGNQANILYSRGDLDGAMVLHKEEERVYRQLGNLDSLQRSLGNQANILYSRGDLDGAMALHKEKEQICRQLGNLEGLQASLGSQANILYSRGDLDGAMALHKEQERICRQLGNVSSLAISLANQALMLANAGRVPDGTQKAEEAYQLASTHGYAALAAQIEPILAQLKSTLKE